MIDFELICPRAEPRSTSVERKWPWSYPARRGWGVSTRCRIEKKEENRERTQTKKHPNGYFQLEVFEKKAATKKDDHNHPNSLQRVNYRTENMNLSGNMVNICMIRAHKIIRHWRTNDFHWKRSMASHSRRPAQNHVAAPLHWEEIESDYGPSGQECYRGGPAHKHPPSIFPAKW